MVYQLVCEGKAVGQKAEDQGGQQGDAVILSGLKKAVQHTLKEQGMGIGHRQDAPFFPDIIISISAGVNMGELS